MGRAIEVLEVMTGEKIKYPLNNFVCSSVISGFCKIGKPELALGFYENAGKIGTLCRPNVVTYTSLVSALCKEGRINEVCDLVCKMEKEGVVLDALFYSSWICGYFREGILEEAFRKHVSMVENGINPDTVSYTILIDGFSKEGNVEKAIGFLNEMKKDGLEPNLVTYTAIMRGFCKRGKLEEAFKVFKRVDEWGIKVDEVTYSTLIDGLCQTGDFDRVFCLLEEMEHKGISTGVITYNTVINGLCKVGRTSKGDEISNTILGDNFTYSTLLHGYIQENNVVGILETKRRLEEARICMDVVMCNVLIKALFMVGALEDAYMTYKGMPEIGLVANSVTYCTMIDGYCKAGRIDDALKIFDAYRSASLVSNVANYNCIIFGLCGNGMIDMAIELFIELIEKGLVPNKVTYMKLIKSIFEERNGGGVLEFLQRVEKLEPEMYNIMCNDAIQFLCKKGCSEAAFGVYLFMKKKGSSVASKGYYSILKGLIADQNRSLVPVMLNAYLKEYGVSESRISKILVRYLSKKDVEKALHFLNKMKENHICLTVPVSVFDELKKQGRVLDAHKLISEAEGNQTDSDIFAYSIVVDGLCKEGHLNKALDLCATMRERRISPNIVIYNSVMNGLCRQGCIVQALRLFDSLEKINLVPTDITYASLIGALSKEGYLQDAKQLFEKMIFKGFTPNTHVYNSLIDGYCKFGFLDEALMLLLDFEKSCFEPDAFTVSAVIDGCCRKGDMEGALGFYFEYKKKGILPDFLGFVYLIKGLCVKGRMEEARSILMEMLQIQSIAELIDTTGSAIKTESLASFLVFLCEQGSIEEATYVLNEVGSMAFPSKRSRTKQNVLYDREALSKVRAKSLTSPYMDNLDAMYFKAGKVDWLLSTLEAPRHFQTEIFTDATRKSILFGIFRPEAFVDAHSEQRYVDGGLSTPDLAGTIGWMIAAKVACVPSVSNCFF
ncbi:Pentatricopeptide repeat [Macleaya cordata]|uniref:Pentatricopeptide repeat n=1 Tax=Macleaya cordata TaxID=56857 RepID=A0A200R9A2_MACCD|nr:Pentatricopeptide repeat [Macleaya cordata]